MQRVGLHKTQAFDGGRQAQGFEQRAGHGVTAQVGKGEGGHEGHFDGFVQVSPCDGVLVERKIRNLVYEMKVAIHQFRAGLSHYVAQAQAGTVIEISRFGKPVAKLVGVPLTASAGLARLMTRGAVQWSGGKPTLNPRSNWLLTASR